MNNCKYCWKKNENRLLKLCRECYYTEQLDNKTQLKFQDIKRTPIKQVSKKRKERLSKYSEKDMFRAILIERQHDWLLTCEYCKKDFRIEDAWPASFAHILSKWLYPALRLFKNNVIIVCNDISMNSCHKKVDNILSWNKKSLETKILSLETINFKDYEGNDISS